MALEEGAKFLYDEAGQGARLDAWRARRRDPAAPLPALVPAPAEVMIGPAQPSGAKPHGDTVLTLEDLRADVEQITTGQLSADDPAARATIAALREVVEAALGASIMFAGEAARPVLGSDINVVVNDVRGRLAGVRLTAGQGGDVTKVRIQAHDVVGGDIVGVDIGGVDIGGRPDEAWGSDVNIVGGGVAGGEVQIDFGDVVIGGEEQSVVVGEGSGRMRGATSGGLSSMLDHRASAAALQIRAPSRMRPEAQLTGAGFP